MFLTFRWFGADDHAALARIDLSRGSGELPGWAHAYTAGELAALLDAYRGVTDEAMWEHLAYFLERVVPVAEKSGVLSALHDGGFAGPARSDHGRMI